MNLRKRMCEDRRWTKWPRIRSNARLWFQCFSEFQFCYHADNDMARRADADVSDGLVVYSNF